MSTDKYDNIVSDLVAKAAHTDDPAKLRGIVEKLNQQSAWDKAKHVQLKIREIDRRYAEAAQK
jgi:hypothetical protein